MFTDFSYSLGEVMGNKFYDQRGEEYSKVSEESAYNKYTERPAFVEVLGSVRGQTVLELGCGNGFYLEYLIQSGAKKVVGVDNSETMLALAKERVGEEVELLVHDLNEPLDQFSSNSFDTVISPLTLHYIEDWNPLFQSVAEVLKPGGRFVFSVSHPFIDIVFSKSKNYFDPEPIFEDWPSYNLKLKTFRRSFTDMVSVAIKHNYTIRGIRETRPQEVIKDFSPELYQKLLRDPNFVIFDLISNKE